MNPIVSKKSLNALANLVFVELSIKEEGDTPGDAEYNLEGGGASEAFYHYKHLSDADATESDRCYFDAFGIGMEFGLALAAAIISNAFDLDATSKAVENELQIISKYWPEHVRTEAPAA